MHSSMISKKNPLHSVCSLCNGEQVEFDVRILHEEVVQQDGVGLIDPPAIAFLQPGVELIGQPASVGQAENPVHHIILKSMGRAVPRGVVAGIVRVAEQLVEFLFGDLGRDFFIAK